MGQRTNADIGQYRYNEGIVWIYMPYMLAFRAVDNANKVVAQGNSAEDTAAGPGKYQVSYALLHAVSTGKRAVRDRGCDVDKVGRGEN